MPERLTLEEGTFLVRFARQAIETYVQEHRIIDLPANPPKALTESRGVFVTLKKRSPASRNHWELRGCIGQLQPPPMDTKMPRFSLVEATRQAAISAAVEDPRFPPVRPEELNKILVEVSVLTVPEEIEVEDRTTLPQHIKIGKDGLIVELNTWRRGLLLPQVAPEQGWDAKEFLQGCCQKAGLPPDMYLDPRVRIFKFQAQIFAETSVGGEVIERTF